MNGYFSLNNLPRRRTELNIGNDDTFKRALRLLDRAQKNAEALAYIEQVTNKGEK